MLIVLRGNSGSGKTTTAYRLREKALEQNPTKKIAVIEQDYLRRKVLKEREKAGNITVGLIEQTAVYALAKDYDVILEGILITEKYEQMLESVARQTDAAYFYYFDIPLEETLKRHKNKPNADEFGEAEMRDWYREKDFLKFTSEQVINESVSQPEIIAKILRETNLV